MKLEQLLEKDDFDHYFSLSQIVLDESSAKGEFRNRFTLCDDKRRLYFDNVPYATEKNQYNQ